MRRTLLTVGISLSALLGLSAPALACGGLVNPNGTVSLLKTTTLAAYVDGVEHYITSFDFVGGGAEFGSIVPLPGEPTDVKRAGDWTLQRLLQEVQPIRFNAALAGRDLADAEQSAEVVLETKIDALDITVVKGGGDAVGAWAKENGFVLTPDAPEILDHYAARSPYFMAARFDVDRAERLDQQIGQGTPIQITIPTDHPWVPLRILGLGRAPGEPIEADVFLLTEDIPVLAPAADGSDAEEGLILERVERASQSLLTDLRSDKGMKWLPTEGLWLSYLRVDSNADELTYDLDAWLGDRGTDPTVPSGDENGSPFDGWLWPLVAVPLAVFGVIRTTNKIADRL